MKITYKSSDFLSIGIHYLSIFISSLNASLVLTCDKSYVHKKEIHDITSGIA